MNVRRRIELRTARGWNPQAVQAQKDMERPVMPKHNVSLFSQFDDQDGVAWCSDCKHHLPKSWFYPVTGRSSGVSTYCRECLKERSRDYGRRHKKAVSERNAEYREKHAQRIRSQRRNSRLARVFGITPEKYNEMLSAQNGVCAICAKPSRDKNKKPLYVDHDHGTGEVRGLLCHRCNAGIGLLGDSADMLRLAIAYLERKSST